MKVVIEAKITELVEYGVRLFDNYLSPEELEDTIEVGIELGWNLEDFANHFRWLNTLEQEA